MIANLNNQIYIKKGFISVRGYFIVLEKCVTWKIQIQILFINDFEVI